MGIILISSVDYMGSNVVSFWHKTVLDHALGVLPSVLMYK